MFRGRHNHYGKQNPFYSVAPSCHHLSRNGIQNWRTWSRYKNVFTSSAASCMHMVSRSSWIIGCIIGSTAGLGLHGTIHWMGSHTSSALRVNIKWDKFMAHEVLIADGQKTSILNY